MHTAARIRVVLAEDQPVFRQAMEDLLAREADLEVVGVAADADEAVRVCKELRPDVAVIDVRMPSGGGPAAARGIRIVSPATKIVTLSSFDDRHTVLEMLHAGAVGYLVKGASTATVLDTIRKAAGGISTLSSEVATHVVQELNDAFERRERDLSPLRDRTARVRDVIEQQRFGIVFQPIVELHGGRLLGVEALSRFNAEPHQPPDVWFADASETGLRAELELATMRAALEVAAPLPPSVYLSLNVSPVTLLDAGIDAAIAAAGSRPVVVELTEHDRVDDYEAVAAALQSARASGVRVAVDDAGAGFSSLRHILLLAPDIVKLDMSLVRDVDRDRSRRALTAALVHFAAELGLGLVAEGVETAAELRALRDIGVTMGQGYHFAKPAPLADLPLPLPATTSG